MITQVQIENRIRLILTILSPEEVDVLKGGWKSDLPRIITNKEDIDANPFGKVDKAATVVAGQYYRLDELTKEDIDHAILEELAHDYYFFTGKHNFFQYRTGGAIYRATVEMEAGSLANKWFSECQKNPDFREDIQ